VVLDDGRNARGEERISADGGRVAVLALASDEEGVIAAEAARWFGRRI
jgi:acetate kinase